MIHYYGYGAISTPSEEHQKIVEAQTNIEWRHFIWGRVAGHLQHIVDISFKQNKKPTQYFTLRGWLQQMTELMINDHVQAWIIYFKHATVFNPFIFRIQIYLITHKSQKYDILRITKE